MEAQQRHPDIGKWGHRHTLAQLSYVWQITRMQLREGLGIHRPEEVCHEAFIGSLEE